MRKTVFILFIALIWHLQSIGQHITPDKVPGAVGKAFRTKFPAASQDSWNKIGEHAYQAVFFNNRKKQSADFDDTGKWLQTETEIDMNQVPGVVMKKMNKEFGGYNIQEADQQEKPEGIFYVLTVTMGSQGYELLYNARGELLKKEAAKPEGAE